MQKAYYRLRLKTVFLFFFGFLLFCVGRLLFIQIFHSNYLVKIAQKQHNSFIELEPRRGTIYDSNLKPLAVNISADSLYASPNEIPDSEKAALSRKLSSILGTDEESISAKLAKKKSFVWLARKISPEQSEAIKKLKLKGTGFIKESKRCYPNAYLASHIVGFAGLDNNGLEGLELAYDKYLRGSPGWAVLLRDARQKTLDITDKTMPPADGFDLVLTIDEVIQYIAEKELEKVARLYNAKGASIVVMDPYTGQVLALANRPTYDLNLYKNADSDRRRNRALTDMFEPGSVFKIVTASAALEEHKVTEEDKFFCENGEYKIAGHILHDHDPHGWLTFRQVIEESSNIGTAKVAMKLGPSLVYRYVKLFGFGSKTGVDLGGEIPGSIKDPKSWSKTSVFAIPMGQEVGVTAMQLASAISVIANGGTLVKPYLVREIRDIHGQLIKSFLPAKGKRILSENTSEKMKRILRGVVEQGTGKLAALKDYPAAGKTGTGQKLDPNGRYSHSKFMASFIGFVPAQRPSLVVAVVVDEPHPYYYGGVVSAPVFKNVSEGVLGYLKSNQLNLAAINENKKFN